VRDRDPAESRLRILERRARFLAAALGGLGCQPDAAPARAPEPPPRASVQAEPRPRAEAAVDEVDSDGDGVRDADDRCPSDVGVHDGDPSYLGCPRAVPMPCLSIVVLHPLEFEPGSARILPASHAVLDEVARILRQEPELSVAIVGHTDDTEPAKLGRARAEAARDYLEEHGLAPARIAKLENAAASHPRADPKSPLGRARNRRVEFLPIRAAER